MALPRGDPMITESAFRVVQGFIFLAFVLHRAYYNRKYPASEGETLEEQRRSTSGWIANLLALPALLGLLLYLVNPAWISWAALPLPDWSRWLGVLVALAGFALLQWSHHALGRNWSDQPRIMQSQTLTTSGPYRWIRHPIYTSFLSILGSSLLVSANWFIGSLWLALTAIDVRDRMRFEETRLHARFGRTYESYKQSTGGLLPRLR